MTKVEQLSLFEKLSDSRYTDKLIKALDIKLSSKSFWKEDEIRYIELQKKLTKEHKLIEMSHEKLHQQFTI
jgi:hypothetical protein